jgi:catechol 2,3-dioxygenase-like lactoylglutathione lyase family enzyme
VKRDVTKTGKFGIGSQIHTVHMCADVVELNRFYQDVFGGLLFMGVDEPTFSPREDRWASLLVISDLCIETMAPHLPVDPTRPVGKFFSKFGQHLHSVGYAVDDLVGLGDSLIAKGVRIGKPGGGRLEKMDPEAHYVFPSPKDTSGLMVELCGFDMPGDPRLLEDWSSAATAWTEHPLGIRRLAYQTLGVRDLDAAVARYKDLFAAETVARGHSVEEGAAFEIVHLGDGLLRLAQPVEPATPLAAHVERYGDMIYSITFRVDDLAAAQDWFEEKKIATRLLGPGLLAAEPADTFGAPYFFTTDQVPSDPFA